ncbi:alpha/beta hydrolase family protein, partial [Allokutzneria sp. NRRL B-24872]|uniref:alpha/beta hydrolase n=1 Tax=Allokutzneria sp. NRRL B-24872 TaxID=1137961 RepID=UPI001AEFEC12
MARRVRALVVAAATAAFTLSSVSGAPAATRSLPAPFSSWDVEVSPKADEQGALTLKYTSPALGMRTTNTVYLPDSYRSTGRASSVMYYLHGTVLPPIDNPVLDPVTGLESLLSMTSAGGGGKQTRLFDFGSQRAKADFLVVAPDTNAETTWCQTCMWINGRDSPLPNVPPVTGVKRPAEDVLYEELIPLVEKLFNVRTTREGRGVMGFSMGGISAMVQGFRHPDRYAFVGSVSGPYDFVDDPAVMAVIEGVGYLRDQGYGSRLTNAADWAELNPRHLVGNFAGSGGTLLLSAGDTCLPPTDAKGTAACAKHPSLTNPAATAIELLIRRNLDMSVSQLSASGVPATQ